MASTEAISHTPPEEQDTEALAMLDNEIDFSDAQIVSETANLNVEVINDPAEAVPLYVKAVENAKWPNVGQHRTNIEEAIERGGGLAKISPSAGHETQIPPTKTLLRNAFWEAMQEVRASRTTSN